MTGPYITTFSGKRVNLVSPRPQDVCIEDIAHHQANICRFTGATRVFYSDAQHSVLVSRYCDQRFADQGLLHEGGETYLNDMNSKLKRLTRLEYYRILEHRHEYAVCCALNIIHPFHKSIKIADMRVFAAERRDLMVQHAELYKDPINVLPIPETIVPWSPEEAEHRFLERYREITNPKFRSEQQKIQKGAF